MIRKLVSAGAVAALLASTPANAAVTVITFLDGASGSHNGAFALDASSNAYSLGALCGATTATLGATIAECAIVNASGQLLTLDTQSGTWNITNITGTISLPTGAMPATGGTVGLVAGSAIVGKFGIDQTTPGTTNAVDIIACASGVCGLPTISGNAVVKGVTAAMTGTTSTQVIAAVSSQHIYVNAIHCNNSSSTGTLVTIQDGSGGTALDTLAAGATLGGDNRNGGSAPLFWTTAGNALFAADVTTGASVICQASGYSSAN